MVDPPKSWWLPPEVEILSGRASEMTTFGKLPMGRVRLQVDG
jgi:hypothetical protein